MNFSFSDHLEVVYFVYGLAFFTMAVSIFSRRLSKSQFKLGHILWLLGGFGLLHGVNEWLDGWTLLKGRAAGLDISRLAILSISFLFLFEFGRQLFRLRMESYPAPLKKIASHLTWILSPLLAIAVCSLSIFTHDLWETGAMGVRYFLAFPSGFLISAGFLLYYHYGRKELEHLKVKQYFWTASLSFLVYGILAGLVVHQGHFGLSPWLNTESFLATARIPAQVLRAGCAIIGCWSTIGLLKIFNLEIIKQLEDEIAWRKQAEGALAWLNAELLKSNEKLKELDQRKSDFVAMVSHEFRNPLGLISEAIQLSLGSGTQGGDSKQKELMEIAKRSAERLIRLVTNILNLSRIEAGKMELLNEKVDMGALVEEVAREYGSTIASKQITLSKEIPRNIGAVLGDRDKLTEVLINLLSNATKYAEKGRVAISLTGTEKEVRFEISDTGPGIPQEHLWKIFDKFERITADRQEGTGLGLPIAKEIIELHRGKLWAESEVGKGSKFIFTLPRSPDKEVLMGKPSINTSRVSASLEIGLDTSSVQHARF
jgi:signal transduction histidine kinase